MAEKEFYEVIVSNPAMYRFQDQILGYLEKNFSILRLIEIESNLVSIVRSLSNNPQRGAIEKFIKEKNKEFRFLLYQETRFFEIKVIYVIEEQAGKVVVTDFFPTKMNPTRMKS
jgi:hypothetical protein